MAIFITSVPSLRSGADNLNHDIPIPGGSSEGRPEVVLATGLEWPLGPLLLPRAVPVLRVLLHGALVQTQLVAHAGLKLFLSSLILMI